jgi:murein DD-endopeptidase MepM/ murein hydrolase activator NlpD
MSETGHPLVRLAAAVVVLAVAGCGWIDWGGEDAAPVTSASGTTAGGTTGKASPSAGRRAAGTEPEVRSAALPPLGARERTVTASAGESLAAVARRARVDPDALAAENGLIRPYALKPGQVLRLPAPPSPVAAASSRPSAGDAAPARTAPARDPPNAEPRRTEPSRPAPPPETEVAGLPQAPAAVARPSDSPRRGGFVWPLRGRLISGFGAKDHGMHNDGINIAAKRGQPVRAVGGGEVAYVGNELRGFGNLVLIKHDDGWVSLYAHNDTIDVARGDKVRRGQVIARAGNTGGVGEPQLHFELRRDKKPVDPLPYLGDGGA